MQLRIVPHLLRRTKEDVAQDIPPKAETIIDVELTTMQKQFYRAIFERNQSFLTKSIKSTNLPSLMNIQMELRKCCNHPYLIRGIEQVDMENMENDEIMDVETSTLNAQERKRYLAKRRVEGFLIPASGKLVLLDKLLPKLQREGHRVLIFSQMVHMIDLIEEYCTYKGYTTERLDGTIGGNSRQKAIDRFNKPDGSFIFLLSTRAGGVGINLTGKSHSF